MPDAYEASKAHDRISYAAGNLVDHQVVDLADLLPFKS
jgi:hypothetical protein